MTDPYQTLNVSSTASDEEVKKAYRELARKYHPDNYHDNPLADLAQEKMKEINAAYDEIQRRRNSAGSSASNSGSYGGYQYQSGYSGSSTYSRIRMAINQNDLALAEQLLSQISDHDAEWNYLKGTICYRRGWIDEARRYFQNACQMDPANAEYRRALNRVENGEASYQPDGYEIHSTGCGSNVCAKVLCTYLVCNACSFGGVRYACCT